MGPHRHLRNFLQTALRRDLNAMIDAGWDEGRAEGIAVGKVEGIALGRAEGKAELLERLLEKSSAYSRIQFEPVFSPPAMACRGQGLEELNAHSDGKKKKGSEWTYATEGDPEGAEVTSLMQGYVEVAASYSLHSRFRHRSAH